MKFVIDIPVHVKNRLEFGVTYKDDLRIMTEALANSIPLPKGHGDLKDHNDIIKSLYDYISGKKTLGQCIDDAPIIIEADKEGENGTEIN